LGWKTLVKIGLFAATTFLSYQCILENSILIILSLQFFQEIYYKIYISLLYKGNRR